MITDAELTKKAESLVNLLKERKMTISLAESCTGGLLAKKITDVSGASEVFHLGIVSYSNDIKHSILGVSSDTLDKFGAVSRQTALEMCIGVKKLSDSDVSISVTGMAGPTSDDPTKPVGLMYVGLNVSDNVSVLELKTDFETNIRENNRLYAATSAFDGLLEILKKAM